MMKRSKSEAVTEEQPVARRKFLLWTLRGACFAGLAGVAGRILGPPQSDAPFVQPPHRFGWQIQPEKCQYCGLCATACVRRPSAVKAVNDQKKCSNCVVCYGHIFEKRIESSKIDSQGTRVCPQHAVERKNYCGGLDGYYLYGINHDHCIGCGACVAECNRHGTKSMFLLIRPDLCLGCNECAIALICPHKAIQRVPLFPVTDQLPETLMQELEDGSSLEPPGRGDAT
jgi:electron transport complex protein RnfB